MKSNTVISEILRGLFLGLLYLQLTRANDTNPKNVMLFAAFYVIMVNGAKLSGIDPDTVTNAFLTKTVFTLVDERVRRQEDVNKTT
jgi:hypothetical protein